MSGFLWLKIVWLVSIVQYLHMDRFVFSPIIYLFSYFDVIVLFMLYLMPCIHFIFLKLLDGEWEDVYNVGACQFFGRRKCSKRAARANTTCF